MAEHQDLRNQPIGYWLKRADQVLTEHVGRVLEDQGLTRFHWQVLNILDQRGVTTRAALSESMRLFVDAAGVDGILDDLARRGWLLRREPDGPGTAALSLTDEGRQGRADVFQLIDAARKRSMEGITEEDYRTVITTLQRMIANLEAGSDQRRTLPDGPSGPQAGQSARPHERS